VTREQVWVGLDLGTSSLKGVALDASGRVVARAREGYDTVRAAAGRAEQDPAAWVAAADAVLTTLAGESRTASWGTICLSAMLPTLVTLDPAGAAIGPALTWEDTRAQAEAVDITAETGAATLYEHTGQPLDGRYGLPMWAWIARHDPERAVRCVQLADAKAYLLRHLTDTLATDPTTAAGYGCWDVRHDCWLENVAALAGAVAPGAGRPGRPALPAVAPAMTTHPLRAGLAAELDLPPGIPVCTGAADSVLAAEALGAVAPGSVAYVWGTSAVILGSADTLVADPRRRTLVTPLARTGWGVEMDLVSAGAAVGWLARLLGVARGDEARVFALAAGALEDSALVALPFLGVGEQGALWDADVRGSVLGLDASHGPGDIARAVLDGIVLESRRCLALLETLGLPRGEVRLSWQGADPWFCRRLSDASRRPVAVIARDDGSSAAGAARLAAAGAGLELPAAETARRFDPDPAASREWDRRWEDHERVLDALRPLFRSRSSVTRA
jgi:xylulokinase